MKCGKRVTLYTDKSPDTCATYIILIVAKSREILWARHTERVGEGEQSLATEKDRQH